MVEGLVIEDRLAGIPHDAGIDLVCFAAELGGFEAEHVVAGPGEEQHLAGVQQSGVNRQYFRKVRQQAPDAFRGRCIDIERGISDGFGRGCHDFHLSLSVTSCGFSSDQYPRHSSVSSIAVRTGGLPAWASRQVSMASSMFVFAAL